MKEALKLALYELEGIPVYRKYGVRISNAITAIKEAVAPTSTQCEVQPEQEPVLQNIEQYRLQMAGISTAALGYWKEGDGIHPDYNTVALRDVAKLYAKYDALYKAQQGAVSHDVIAGALFDFMGWLTSRPKRIMLSSVDDASPAVDAIKDFSKLRGLSLDDARVQAWQDVLKPMETEK